MAAIVTMSLASNYIGNAQSPQAEATNPIDRPQPQGPDSGTPNQSSSDQEQDDTQRPTDWIAIADVTGLARETVRRKVNRLIELSFAEVDGFGHVRPTRQLADPRWQTVADQAFAAVQRYDRKLRSLGCKGVGE